MNTSAVPRIYSACTFHESLPRTWAGIPSLNPASFVVAAAPAPHLPPLLKGSPYHTG